MHGDYGKPIGVCLGPLYKPNVVVELSDIQEQLWDYEQRLYVLEGAKEASGTMSNGARAALERIKKGGIFEEYRLPDAKGKQQYKDKLWRTYSSLRRTIYGTRSRPARNGAERNSQKGARGYARAERPDSGVSPLRNVNTPAGVVTVKAVFRPGKSFNDAHVELNGAPPRTFVETDDTPQNRQVYSDAIKRVFDQDDFGKQVTVPSPDDLKGARMFFSEDGLSMFVLKGDEIVYAGALKGSAPKSYQSMLQLAVDEGGRRLDCFDTFLPRAYA